jgi:uncharacterized protein YjbI with pentapeptide repeats
VGGARAVFAFCDLSGLDLSGRSLGDADFTGAVLEETNLAGANLENADLSGCNLTGADLKGAILIGAKLDLVTTHGANLSEALTEATAGRTPADLATPIEELLDAHGRWAESDGREGRPADFTAMDLRNLKGMAHRALTALIAP